ncbi:MAG TPA: site-specific integrase [Steroidobacteraceae bacterium]|jgi:integrase
MATILEIPSTKADGALRYRAQVRVKGRSESKTFSTRKKAEAWASRAENDIEDGKHFPRAKALRTTFHALVDDYLKTKLDGFDEKERATRTRQLTWWTKQLAGLTVAQIGTEQISRARDACAAETFTRGKPRTVKGKVILPKEYRRTPATVNRFLQALSHVLSFAANERELIDRNPMAKIGRGKEPRGRTRFLSDDERAALLAACEKSDWAPLHTLVLLAITTGARRGELLALKWTDVDLKTGRALVRESKNDEQRTLVLAGKALESLRRLKLHNSARSEWIFPNPSNHPGPFENIDGYWRAATKAAGLKNFRFHDLRHTCASYLAKEGRSLLEIANVLGHKTMSVVQRYAHLLDDDKARAVEQMIAAKGL